MAAVTAAAADGISEKVRVSPISPTMTLLAADVPNKASMAVTALAG